MCRALVLLAASGSAFVVPPRQLARRQTSSDVTAASRPERAPAPASWQNESVGGVRVERLVALAGVGALSYSTYVLGSEALDAAARVTHRINAGRVDATARRWSRPTWDRVDAATCRHRIAQATMVAQLGISRSKSVAAFGPFVTLLGLVYSTLLSNIYSFYLSRQSKILDDLFAETYAVRDLYEVGTTVDASSTANEALRTHALRLRATGFQPSADDGQRALRDLFAAAAEFERAAAIEAPELGKYFSAASPLRRRDWVAAAPRPRPGMGRGGAAATTWIVRGRSCTLVERAGPYAGTSARPRREWRAGPREHRPLAVGGVAAAWRGRGRESTQRGRKSTQSGDSSTAGARPRSLRAFRASN